MAEWVRACAVEDIEVEDVAPFEHQGVSYAIYRSPEDEFFATAGLCTHGRAPLCDGLVMDNIIECPKHNGRFDYRTGEPRGGPVLVPLDTYPAMVRDGAVYIDIQGPIGDT